MHLIFKKSSTKKEKTIFSIFCKYLNAPKIAPRRRMTQRKRKGNILKKKNERKKGKAIIKWKVNS